MKTQKHHFYSKFIGLIAFLVLSFGSITNAFSQRINVNVTVLPPYPIYLENYINKGNAVIITLTNTSNESQKIRLIPALEGNNGVSVKVKPSFFPVAPIILNPNQTRTFTYNQLQSFNANLTENDVQIQGVSTSTLMQNEALPEGAYSLCIKAYDFESNELLSSEFGCASILITNYDPPIMVLPLHEAKIAPMKPQFVNFVWTPAGIPSKTRYRLQIVDMSANNLFNINDAFNNAAIQTYFDKDNIITNTFSYTQAMPPLQKGRKYAIRVTAYDPSKTIQFKNQGHSPVTSFIYDFDTIIIVDNGGGNGGGNGNVDDDKPKDIFIIINPNDLPDNPNNPNIPKDPQDSPECLANCQNAAPSPSAPLKLAIGQEIIVGRFKLKITSINGNNSGEGTIFVAFLNAPIKVKFTDLKVNDGLQLFEGNVYAKIDNANLITTAISENPNADLQNVVSKAKEINQFLGDNARKVSKMGGNVPIGLPLSLDNNGYNLAVVGIIFSPTEAKMHMMLGVEIPQILQNDLFTLSGVGLGIRPNGFCADTQGKISLSSDKSYSLSTDLNLVFNGGAANTYATFSCKGIEKVALKGNLEWSRNKVLPFQSDKVVDGDKKLKATFQTEIEKAGDWIFEAAFNYPSFVLPSAQNLVFAAPSLSLDLSGKKTPNEVKVKHKKGNDWVGIYIQNLTVTLPKVLQKKDKPLILEAKEFIIDKLGFSGKIDLKGELLSINDGNVADWGISLEKFGITLTNSSLTGGLMEGKLKIPLTDEPLNYEGSIVQANQTGEADFIFSVITNEDYSVSAWVATLKLEEDSKITIQKMSNKWGVAAELNGAISINWDNGKGKNKQGEEEELKNNGVSSFSLPEIRFEKLSLKTGSDKFLESWSKFALDNPNAKQSSLAKFPLSFNKEHPLELIAPQQGEQNYGIRLSPELSLMNAANGIKGGTTFTIYGNFDKKTKTFNYQKTTLNSISIDVAMGVASLKGKVDIYKQDAVFGNGFRGEIEVDIQKLIKINSTLQIGKTLDTKKGNQTVEGFRYWYFDAMAKLETGLPMTASLSVYGFGGGAWYNMKRGENPKAVSFDQFKTVKHDPNSKVGETVSGTTFTPEKDKIGFKANIVIGLSGGPATAAAFNADLGLEMNMRKDEQSGLALESLILTGDGYFMQPIDLPIANKLKAVVNASIKIEVDVVKPAFHLSGMIGINAGEILNGKGTLEMHFEPDTWYIYLGKWSEEQALQDEPWKDKSRLNVNVNLGIKLNFNGYFMMGNKIPTYLPSVPKKVRETLNLPLKQVSQYQKAKDGKGFAMGVGFKVGFDAKFLFLYANFEVLAGFDVLIVKLGDETLCNNSSSFGINKWRASGQAYTYLSGDVGFEAKLFGKMRKLSLINLKAAAVIELEVPNPSYLAGAFAVKGGILGNLIKINMSFDFKVGEKCEYTGQQNVNPFDDYPIISQIAPKENEKDMSVMTDPSVGFNMAIHKNQTSNSIYPKNIFKLVIPVEGQEKDDISTVFVQLEKAELSYQENGKKVIVAGKMKLDGQYQKEGYFVANDALKANTKYTFFVEVTGWEIENGISKKLTIPSQTKTTTFTTGKGLTSIPESAIVSAEPFGRERFVFIKERQGMITLTKSICDQPLFDKWAPSKGSTQFVARFTNLTTGESVDTKDVDCASHDIRFQIPQLKSSTIYELSIMRIDKPAISNFAAINVVQEEKSLGGGSVAYYTALKNNKTSNKGVETKLITYHFRTGKYNSLIDKINAMSIKQAELATVPIDNNEPVEIVMIALESDEPIDVLNAYGFDTGTRGLGFGTNESLVPPVTNGFYLKVGTGFQDVNQFPVDYLKTHFKTDVLQAAYGQGITKFIPDFSFYRYATMNRFGKNKLYSKPPLLDLGSVMFYRPAYQTVYKINGDRKFGWHGNTLFKPDGITYTLPMAMLSNSEIQEAKAKMPKQEMEVGNVGLQIAIPTPPKNQFNNNFGLNSNAKYYIPVIEYSNYIVSRDIVAFKKFINYKTTHLTEAESVEILNGANGVTFPKLIDFTTSFKRPLYPIGGSNKYKLRLEHKTFDFTIKN